jgi:serine/threonine-protein kinase
MGQVELAVRRQGDFQRSYAVKRLHPHLRDDPRVRAMFVAEARIAGLIRHPNVVSVLEVGIDEQGPFMVMDYVDGIPLSKLIVELGRTGAALSVQACVRIAKQTAQGLHAAHELCGDDGRPLHLVHRDVTPQNILIGFDGAVRLTDFGIVKALGHERTSTGVLKGKLGYLSPEQLRFEPPDRRSDLFSLGVVLHEMLAGERLYSSDDGAAVARQILEAPPPDIGDEREDVPPELVELLFRLLAKDPAHRPATGLEVVQRLEMILTEILLVEGPVDLGAFVSGSFPELQAERRDQIARALTAPEEEADVAASPPAPQPARRGPLGLPPVFALLTAVLLLVAAGAIGTWFALTGPGPAPAPRLRAAAPRRADAATPDARGAAAPGSGARRAGVAPPSGRPGPRRSRARRRSKRRRPKSGAKSSGAKSGRRGHVKDKQPKIPTWEWD